MPSALATKVPVVCRYPVTGTVAQPRLSRLTSLAPVSSRQEDVTFQVPTTSPPQGLTSVQLAGMTVVPPVPVTPPVPLAPPVPTPPVTVAPPVTGAPPVPL